MHVTLEPQTFSAVMIGIVIMIVMLAESGGKNDSSSPTPTPTVNITADKLNFTAWPDASIFVPWNHSAVPVNYSRFSSLTPYDPNEFTGSQAFLALNGGNLESYGLPFETCVICSFFLKNSPLTSLRNARTTTQGFRE